MDISNDFEPTPITDDTMELTWTTNFLVIHSDDPRFPGFRLIFGMVWYDTYNDTYIGKTYYVPNDSYPLPHVGDIEIHMLADKYTRHPPKSCEEIFVDKNFTHTKDLVIQQVLNHKRSAMNFYQSESGDSKYFKLNRSPMEFINKAVDTLSKYL